MCNAVCVRVCVKGSISFTIKFKCGETDGTDYAHVTLKKRN